MPSLEIRTLSWVSYLPDSGRSETNLMFDVTIYSQDFRNSHTTSTLTFKKTWRFLYLTCEQSDHVRFLHTKSIRSYICEDICKDVSSDTKRVTCLFRAADHLSSLPPLATCTRSCMRCGISLQRPSMHEDPTTLL